LYFNVHRGVAGEPLISPPRQQPEVVPQEQQQAAAPGGEETFEGWLAERGVTKSMYNDLDKQTRWELEMAFNQRHKKDAEFILLPPKR